MCPTVVDQTPWWGSFTLEENRGGEWRVGPSTLWIYRSSQNWRIIHRPSTSPSAPDPLVERSGFSIPIEEDEMAAVLAGDDDDLVTSRYSVRRTREKIALRPSLADRRVVCRPEHSVYVLPDEAVTLYLSTPLWIRIELEQSDRLLTEVPSHRLSDTWFGSTTVEGTLCYATRTAGRFRPDRLPRRLHRAITPLKVRNRASEPLALERVQLPVPHLALYSTSDESLWTNGVTMTHATKGEGAAVQIRDGAPADLDSAEHVQDARERERHGLFTTTFSAVGALFGP